MLTDSNGHNQLSNIIGEILSVASGGKENFVDLSCIHGISRFKRTMQFNFNLHFVFKRI